MTDQRSTYYTSSYYVSRLLRPGEFQTAVTLNADSGSAQANKDRIYLALADTLYFHPGDTVFIEADDVPSGEKIQIQSVVESGANSYLETVSDMTKSYLTANNATVQLLSKYRRDGEGSGLNRIISTREINDYINEAEATIDKRTHHAWTEKTVTNEIHDYPIQYRNAHDWLDGIPIKLHHRSIKTLDDTEGDDIELYEGTSGYVSKLSGWTEHTDYWVDTTLGFLYLKKFWKWHSRAAIRITYRYGESTVPDDIRRCATLLAAIMILENEAMLGIDDENNVADIDRWRKEADEIIKDHEEMLFYRS
jgi:hypothetical protein